MNITTSNSTISPFPFIGTFNDIRLQKRGEQLIKFIFRKKTAILNRLAKTRKQLVAYSRFLHNPSVTTSELVKEATSDCSHNVQGKHILCIEDTTELNYESKSGKLCEDDTDLGPMGNNENKGFFLHPTLAVDADDLFPLGFSDIYCWNRSLDKGTKFSRKYTTLPIEQKESFRWIRSALNSKKQLDKAKHITIIADREGDIYEEFALIPDDKTDILIRSKSDRKLYKNDKKLFDHLAHSKVQGTYTIDIPGDMRRKRKARKAIMEVRFSTVKIKRPKNINNSSLPDFIEINAVETKEKQETVPDGEEPIIWHLLTTHKVKTIEQAQTIINWYCARWLIEQLFRTLKTQGLDIEASQLESGQALKKLAIIALQASLKIMQLVQERDGHGGYPATIIFEKNELSLLEKLSTDLEGNTTKQQNPHSKYSLAWAAWVIGRLGGWKGYASQSPPGPISMKRGLEEFRATFIGWSLASIA